MVQRWHTGLGFGLALTAMGGLGFAWKTYFPNPWVLTAFVASALAFLVLFVWDRKIISALKARVTYPRTGYVVPPREGYLGPEPLLTLGSASADSAQKNVSAFRMGVVYLLLVGMILLNFFRDRWSVALVMPALSIAVYYSRRWSERPYAWWLMIPLALSGIPFSALDVPMKAQGALPMLLGGLWLSGIGGWTLLRYLQKNRKA